MTASVRTFKRSYRAFLPVPCRDPGLQDFDDKRTIVADHKLRAVFGKDRATMFEMNALLSPHLKSA